MKLVNLLVIIILVGSIAFGGGLGLFLQNTQPPGQVYRFEAFAVQTDEPISCGTIPKNYTEWLGIEVIGNRTEMNFATASVYDPGNRISITLPLNGTANVDYRPMNSTFEKIIVPLAQYFDSGNALSLTVTYSISTFSPQTQSIVDIPIIQGNITC